jgi:hypothetical protein
MYSDKNHREKYELVVGLVGGVVPSINSSNLNECSNFQSEMFTY